MLSFILEFLRKDAEYDRMGVVEEVCFIEFHGFHVSYLCLEVTNFLLDSGPLHATIRVLSQKTHAVVEILRLFVHIAEAFLFASDQAGPVIIECLLSEHTLQELLAHVL